MLTLRALGGFELLIDGVPAKCSFAPARLFCRLAVDAGRPVHKSRLWQDLWPDSDSPDVVDVNIRRLRRDVLAAEGHRLRNDGSVVTLNLEDAEVDFLQFKSLIETGSDSTIESALQLYRGDLFVLFIDEPWLLDLRDELKTDYEDALKVRAEAAIQSQDFLVASRYLRRFIQSNPGYEWGWYQLISTYSHWGNVAEALSGYKDYVDYIRKTNNPPSGRIEEVVKRLRNASTADIRVSGQAEEKPDNLQSGSGLAVFGGALPPTSPYYIARPEDAEARVAFLTTGTTVRIKGPKQVGKSSLLARCLRDARSAGFVTLHTDWQNLPHNALVSLDAFYLALAHKLTDLAQVDGDPALVFRDSLAPGDNFDRFLMRFLIPAIGKPVIWAIDEADRIFSTAFYGEVFSKMRAWHNERALDPSGPFALLSLVLSYATEARMFIPNLNQSPFNVGVEIRLRDFTYEQVTTLDRAFGSPLGDPAAVRQLYHLTNGHPYLSSRSLCESRTHHRSIAEIREIAGQADGLFADHLERLRFTLDMNPVLRAAVSEFIQTGTLPDPIQVSTLIAAGIFSIREDNALGLRCLLYEQYLRNVLVNS